MFANCLQIFFLCRMKTSTSTNIYLDTRRIKKDNTYPVKLRVTYGRKSQFYNTSLSLTREAFETVMTSGKPRQLEKDIRAQLTEIEKKANRIIEKMTQFTFPTFDKKFLGPEYQTGDIFAKYEEYIKKLEENEQFGTASSYRCSMASLKKFLTKYHNYDGIIYPLTDITIELLQDYEKYMINENGSSASTVGVYLRPLRALLNTAREEEEISNDLYPFGKRKYQIPATTSHKRPVEESDMKKLFEATADEYEEKARDFWMLSYLCNGINMRDLVQIKFGINLLKEEIIFLRGKTKKTSKRDAKVIIVPLIDETVRIINKYKNDDQTKGKYVFPILSAGMSSKEKYVASSNFNRFVGQHLKTLAKKAGINESISPLWARHTFATTMRYNGSGDELISESLGHSDVRTTTNYLNSFRMKEKKKFANKLMNFNK